MTSQLALVVYVMLFLSAIVLRKRRPDVPRPCKIKGLPLIALIGLCITVLVGIFGFFPPSQLHIDSPFWYEVILIGGVCVLFLSGVAVTIRRQSKG